MFLQLADKCPSLIRARSQCQKRNTQPQWVFPLRSAEQELNGMCRHAMLRLFPSLKVNKDVNPRDACYIAAKTLYSQLGHYACDKITYIILYNNAGLYIHVTLENIPIPLALTSQIATGPAPPSLSHDTFHWSGRSMWHSEGGPLKSTVIEAGIREWYKCMGKPEDHKGD